VEKYGTAKQVTDDNIIRCMYIACWIDKSTDTHSKYAILSAFPQQQWLCIHLSMHIYTYYIAYFVCNLHHFVQKRRELRRRTWCGHASRKSMFSFTPSLQTIDENSAHFFEQECLSTAIQDLANNSKTKCFYIFSVQS
jgi:hypothetical protein